MGGPYELYDYISTTLWVGWKSERQKKGGYIQFILLSTYVKKCPSYKPGKEKACYKYLRVI